MVRPALRLVALAHACASCVSDPGTADPADGGRAAASEAQSPRVLALAESWVRSLRADDPLSSDVPADAGCDPYAEAVEETHLEIDMTACRFIALEQPARTSAASGERLSGMVWHLGLLSAAPSEAHAALVLGGRTVWEVRVPIPSPAEAWTLDIDLAEDVHAGDPVRFHLHNHGANHWRLGELQVQEPRRVAP